MSITAILLNYRRPDNMVAIIDALRRQTLPVSIFLIDNAEESIANKVSVEKYIHVPWNAGAPIRLYLGPWVETPKIMFLDDDLLPDETFVEVASHKYEKHAPKILGAYGRRLSLNFPHYGAAVDRERNVEHGPTEIVKGRVMLFDKKLLQHLVAPEVPLATFRHADDVYLSLATGRAQPAHFVARELREHLHELPAGRHGDSKKRDHYRLREEFCSVFLRQIAR